MSNDQDLNALMSSEVFRNYLALENEREANQGKLTAEDIKILKRKAKDTEDIITAFAEFELSVKENRFLKKAFLDMQKQIQENPALVKRLGVKFVDAIMMLDLE